MILLSESNVIVYANKCAARILRVKEQEAGKPEDTEDVEGEKQPELDQPENEEGAEEDYEKPVATGLEGHTIDQLNISLADEDVRMWVSIVQVFENIKLNLNKREERKKGRGAADRADLYGEGPKYNSYDYYGDLERANKGHGAHADNILRDTAPIVIEREDGKAVPATMYVALIDPYSTGYSYSSVSFVPGKIGDDATFTTQMTIEDRQARRRRKRDLLKMKKNEGSTEVEELPTEQATGRSGESMVKRVKRIKDLILDEMEYCFIALSPDGDIVITNAATKAVLGKETLEASIG